MENDDEVFEVDSEVDSVDGNEDDYIYDEEDEPLDEYDGVNLPAVIPFSNRMATMFDYMLFAPFCISEDNYICQTCPFECFDWLWMMKAIISGAKVKPKASIERKLTIQLVLKDDLPDNPLKISFSFMNDPNVDMKINSYVYKHEFTATSTESACFELTLPAGTDWDDLFAKDGISFRLLMVLTNE